MKDGFTIIQRGIATYHKGFADIATEVGPYTESDIIIVSIAAHYGKSGPEAYTKDMTALIHEHLKHYPATVYWREYAPSHFGGETGEFKVG